MSRQYPMTSSSSSKVVIWRPQQRQPRQVERISIDGFSLRTAPQRTTECSISGETKRAWILELRRVRIALVRRFFFAISQNRIDIFVRNEPLLFAILRFFFILCMFCHFAQLNRRDFRSRKWRLQCPHNAAAASSRLETATTICQLFTTTAAAAAAARSVIVKKKHESSKVFQRQSLSSSLFFCFFFFSSFALLLPSPSSLLLSSSSSPSSSSQCYAKNIVGFFARSTFPSCHLSIDDDGDVDGQAGRQAGWLLARLFSCSFSPCMRASERTNEHVNARARACPIAPKNETASSSSTTRCYVRACVRLSFTAIASHTLV